MERLCSGRTESFGITRITDGFEGIGAVTRSTVKDVRYGIVKVSWERERESSVEYRL